MMLFQPWQVACGAGHNLAVNGEGQLYSWGKCHFGQLGHGEEDQDKLLPTAVKSAEALRVEAAGCGDSHSLVVAQGRVWVTLKSKYFRKRKEKTSISNGRFSSPKRMSLFLGPSQTNCSS